MMETGTIRWLKPGDNLADAYEVRKDVFIEEQHVPPELEMDDIDAVTDHVVLYDGMQPVATGRIVRGDGAVTIGRIAVRKPYRGKGYGAQIVRLLTDRAFEEGAKEVHLHSQTHAVQFYEKLGFQSYGDIYEEAGIPHRSMVLRKS